MGVLGNVVIAVLAIAGLVRAFTLHFRYLQDGIAYLRDGQVVMDVAMPLQGVALAIVSTVATLAVIHVDPSYPGSNAGLLLVLLDVPGAMGLIIVPMYLMTRSSMMLSIDFHQPLFLRDRTPGCRSTRHVTVYVGGPSTLRTRHRGVLHLR